MKILYCVQLTGNGHITRANELIRIFKKRAHVDVLVSGTQSSLKLKEKVKFRYKGLSFVFGKEGGIDFIKTIKIFNLFRFIKEILNCPVDKYDLIINDFEPISAWASFLKRKEYCFALSHQFSLLNKKTPKPGKIGFFENLILKYYSPCKRGYGFHFKSYDNKIFTPIIKNNLRKKEIQKGSHITVYLASYSNEYLHNIFKKFYKTHWHIFSPKVKNKYQRGNIKFYPTSYDVFEESILSCNGVICNAGFELPSEALFLKKKLLVIPMKHQFEQDYNAKALKDLGVTVLKSLNVDSIDQIKKWIKNEKIITMQYENQNNEIVDRILLDYIQMISLLKIKKNLDKDFFRDTIL